MAYDEYLAQRVRDVLSPMTVTNEMKMFGGIAFMVSGNMTIGVRSNDLIVRVGLKHYEASLHRPGVDLFQPTGKPMAGWVTVSPEGHRADDDMKYWINRALEFVKTLPAK